MSCFQELVQGSFVPQYPTRVSWLGIPEIAALRGAILQDRNNCELQEKGRQTLAMFVRVRVTKLLAMTVKSPAKTIKAAFNMPLLL
jgi:hypothetical protein